MASILKRISPAASSCPQVAVEYGWDRETFLGQTSIKAGMKHDDWKEGADLYIFSADVFHEK